MQKMRRRLNCSVPSTYRELKKCTVGGWNKEVVHTSMEGVGFHKGEFFAEYVAKKWFAKGGSCGGGRL
jgi:hypothetical protein